MKSNQQPKKEINNLLINSRHGVIVQIHRYDWLFERTRWRNLARSSCLLETTRCVPREKFLQKRHTNSFTDQACSIQVAGY